MTFYDAAYLAVAFEIQGTFITADERFVKRMGKIEQLCLLKNLDLGSADADRGGNQDHVRIGEDR